MLANGSCESRILFGTSYRSLHEMTTVKPVTSGNQKERGVAPALR